MKKNLLIIGILGVAVSAFLVANCAPYIYEEGEWDEDCGCYVTTINSPDNVSASSGAYNDKIIVSWNTVSGASEYSVYRSVSAYGTYTKVGISSSTTFYDTQVTIDSVYYYKVVAYAESGSSSSYSAVAVGYTASGLTAPTVAASDGSYNNKIRLTWAAADGATQYYIYRASSSAGTYSEIGSTTSLIYDDYTPTPGIFYYYKLRAYNSTDGLSDYGAYDSGYADDCTGTSTTSLSAPTGVQASDGTYENMIQVSWNAVFGAAGYYIYRSASANGTYNIVGESATTYFHNYNVAEGMVYYYKVKAYYDASVSDYSGSDSGYAMICNSCDAE